MLSERYGWTPSQIRKEKYSDMVNYFDIISVRNIIEKENSKRYKK